MLYRLLLLFCLYIPFQLALNASEGVDLASGRVFALVLGIMWLLAGFKNKKIFIPDKIQTILLLSFLFLNSLSLIFAENTSWGLRKLLFLFSFIPLYFIVSDVIQNKEWRKKIITALVWGAGLVSTIGIIQFFLQFFIGIDETLRLWQKIIAPFLGNAFAQSVFENPSWLVGVSGKNYLRAIAFFPDPHMFSFYLGMLLPFSLFLFRENRRKVYLIISAMILAADILTFSRGGYLGLLAGAMSALFVFRKNILSNISIKKFAAFNIIILLIAVTIIFPNPISQRLSSSFDIKEGSNIGRIETWRQSLEVINNNPLGVGIGNYPLEIKPSADYREPIYSHNLYLDIAAETGIINALIFIWLIIVSILNFIKLGKNNPLLLAGAIGLIIFSVHSIFETPLYSIHILPLLLIIIALSTIKNE